MLSSVTVAFCRAPHEADLPDTTSCTSSCTSKLRSGSQIEAIAMLRPVEGSTVSSKLP